MANSLPRKPQFRQELRQRAHARAAFSSQSAKPRFWVETGGRRTSWGLGAEGPQCPPVPAQQLFARERRYSMRRYFESLAPFASLARAFLRFAAPPRVSPPPSFFCHLNRHA